MPKPEAFVRDTARITVTVAGVEYSGWLSSEVSRDLESITGTFSIPVSLVPGRPPNIQRGQAVEVRIGGTLVLTGWVMAAEPFYMRDDCGMRITGIGRTGDLVRCSAIYKGGQWRKASLERIAKDLIKPYGLSLVVDAGLGAPIADFKLGHGETVLDALSRAARMRGVLLSTDQAGRLVLTKAGKHLFPGAIVRGLNVISMEGVGSDESRHSTYIAYGQANVQADFEHARGLKAHAEDKGVGRYRPLVINADGNITQADLQALVQHTARVRRGHSIGFRYVVEGWTWQGKPWPLNEKVAIYDDVAGLDGQQWLIASVRQTCSLREGDVTEMLVRPVEAYDTLPIQSLPRKRAWKKPHHDDGPEKQRGPNDKAKS